MKEKELRENAICNLCGKKIGHMGLPLFWRVRIRRYGVKMDAVQRQQGLTMFFGGHAAIAAVMGPNEDMAEQISETEITVCESCAIEKRLPVAALAEEKE